MMKRIVAMALVLASAGVVRGEDNKYAPEGKKIEIVFPGKPMETDLGKGMGKMLILPAEAGKAVYLFYHSTFPKEVDVSNKEIAATIFKGGLEGGLRSWKGKVAKEKDFIVNKTHPAKEYEIEAPNIGIIRLQLILTKNEFYQVAIGGSKEFVDSATAKKFVESFKLKD